MRPTILIRAAAIVAAAAAVSSAQAYSSIIAFGDSLSDTGNAQARLALGGLDIPAAPYFQDRFSNGPVAVEVMAQALGVSLTSYAVGGAETGFDNHIPAGGLLNGTGMRSQVNNFITGLGAGSADAGALYFLWGGGNDFFTLLDSPNPNAPAVIAAAVGNLATEVGQLYGKGAREFFVPLLPDLAGTVIGIEGGPVVQAGLTALTNAYNTALSGALGQLEGQLAGANIQVFNTQTVLEGVRTSLLAQGGTVNAPCWTGDYDGTGGTLCANPDSYFLFDDVHPTAVVHRATGLAMAAAVPEPESLSLLLAGLGVAGALGTRRRTEGAHA